MIVAKIATAIRTMQFKTTVNVYGPPTHPKISKIPKYSYSLVFTLEFAKYDLFYTN